MYIYISFYGLSLLVLLWTDTSNQAVLKRDACLQISNCDLYAKVLDIKREELRIDLGEWSTQQKHCTDATLSLSEGKRFAHPHLVNPKLINEAR